MKLNYPSANTITLFPSLFVLLPGLIAGAKSHLTRKAFIIGAFLHLGHYALLRCTKRRQIWNSRPFRLWVDAFLYGVLQLLSLRVCSDLNSEEKYVVAIGVRYLQTALTQGNGAVSRPQDHLLLAASLMVAAPCLILFFLGQRYFIQGIVTTGIKG